MSWCRWGKVHTLPVPALHFSSSSVASPPSNVFVKSCRQLKVRLHSNPAANPLTSSISLYSPAILQGAEALNKLLKTFSLIFFFCLLLHVFPRSPIKSLPCSCFLYKWRDELKLIKRKLRGHTEVLGSVKQAVAAALVVVAAVERNIELYTHLGSI